MRKLIAAMCIGLSGTIGHAQTCPDVKNIYKYENGVVVPNAPPGWVFAHGDKSINSTAISFKYAAWDSQRMDPADERRVMCIYGTPDFTKFFLFETVNTVEREFIENHPQWKRYGDTYFRCETLMPNGCSFG